MVVRKVGKYEVGRTIGEGTFTKHCPFSTLIASQILPLLNTTSSTKDVNHGELCKAPLQFIHKSLTATYPFVFYSCQCLNLQQNGKLMPKQKVKVIRGTNLAVRDMMTSDPNVILTLGKQPPGYFLLFELHVKVNIQNIPRRDIRERKTGFRNGFCLNLGFAFTAMYAGLYVCLDKKAGSVAVLLCVLCWVQSPCLLAVLLTLQAQRFQFFAFFWAEMDQPFETRLEERSFIRIAVGQFLNIPKAYLCFSNDDINDEFCDATFGPLIHDLIARECPFLEIACILIAGLTFILWLIVFSIHDLIAREGRFLEIACILIAGLTIILWLIVVVSSIVLAVFMNILIGLYASVVVYQVKNYEVIFDSKCGGAIALQVKCEIKAKVISNRRVQRAENSPKTVSNRGLG
ncbi:hypothetical protein DVH24_027989 [Malus domestica]|uniref:Uncharacterized protein n=1 Tax=Malus domestica TaxID=3750 RepID=A0A498HD98_MALDO|nr:hypothetical protein DVH24_027989 [Malus domestica]